MSSLAFDLGASSGRAVLGHFDGERLTLQEIHRFSNDPVQVGNHLHWDLLRLFHEIKQGIIAAKHQDSKIESMGIDSWAVDFGLISRSGELLGNPYHYRDHQTDEMMEAFWKVTPKAEIFARTGIQFLQFNTLYQLFALKKAHSPLLEQADTLLLIPDLLRYFLTGERRSEFTNASTTQLMNASTRIWDSELIGRLSISQHLFADIVTPGTTAGYLQASVCKELDLPAFPVIAVGEHDTASAVAAVPTDQQHFAYLSCGTWSLLGTEVAEPVINELALELNFTNEGGINGTFRLLKNIMGLWLLQECKRCWDKQGKKLEFSQLTEAAKDARPFQSLIDPDHPMFLNPANMPEQIQAFCRTTNQPVPDSVSEIVRCIIESLALKYRMVLEYTESLSGQSFTGLHMVGGGIQNQLLCQFTANAIGRPVWAGPTEASAIGNLLVQLIALDKLSGIWEARQVVKNSFPIATYHPEDEASWKNAYVRFLSITNG